MNIDKARSFWKVARDFPPEKETVYPAHAKAHHFDEQAKGRVLEYGCGGGSDTISLLRRGAEVFFVDIVSENVATTRERVTQWCRDQKGVAPEGRAVAAGCILERSEDLPFEEACFDSVNCHGVLHHIPVTTMFDVIQEMLRVLKPGGHLYAMLYTEHLWKKCWPTMEGLINQRRWADDRAFGYMTDGGNDSDWCIARSYTEAEGRELFEELGFEFVEATEYNDADFRTFVLRKPL